MQVLPAAAAARRPTRKPPLATTLVSTSVAAMRAPVDSRPYSQWPADGRKSPLANHANRPITPRQRLRQMPLRVASRVNGHHRSTTASAPRTKARNFSPGAGVVPLEAAPALTAPTGGGAAARPERA